jgi:imidazolonepropionase
LSVGKEADLLLWDIDHPAQLAYEVGSLKPRLRFVRGEVKYASNG